MMDFVSWDDDIPNIWKNKKCSKPPTRNRMVILPETKLHWKGFKDFKRRSTVETMVALPQMISQINSASPSDGKRCEVVKKIIQIYNIDIS
jgi:hypothetical protein